MILGAPGKLSLQLQGWETLGYSSFALVLVSLLHTEAHVHVHTHLSLAHLVFSPQHKFLCSLAFIQAHPLPGRQAMYFPCTFNSKYTYVFPMGVHTLFPLPHVQGGIKTVHQHHRHHMHPFMVFFYLSPAPCQRWQRALCSFCSILLAKGREGRRMKTFLVLLSLLKGHAKTRLVSPQVRVTKIPTFPYSLALFHCLLSRHLIGLWVYFAFSTDISSIRLLYILAYRLTHMIYCSHP